METKINIQQASAMLKDGKLGLGYGPSAKFTLEELRNHMLNMINKFVDNLYISTEGHTVTHGVVVYPLIHIIHDDESLDNKDYQDFLIKEKKFYRKQKLLQIEKNINI